MLITGQENVPAAAGRPYAPTYTAPAPSAVDAFGRALVSEPVQVFASTHDQDSQGDLWFTETTGAATITRDADRRSMILTVNGIGDRLVRESRQCIPYRAGQSQHPVMTFVLGAPAAGVRRRVGLFDDNDGIFFEDDASGDGYSVVVRSSTSGVVVENRVPRASWDGYQFSGGAPYGVTADPTKGQIFDFDFQHLGMGEVRLRFAVRDGLARIHTFSHVNLTDGVYMRSGTLPLRYEIEATGAIGAAHTLEMVCSAVSREGSAKEPAAVSAVDSLTPHALTLNQPEAVLGLRLASDHLGASLADFVATVLACDNSTSARYKWELIIDPTFAAAPTWAGDWTAAADTEFCEVNRPTGVNTITPGTGRKIASGLIGAGRGATGVPVRAGEALPLARRDRTTAQELVLVVTPIVTGSGLAAAGAINFREQH